MEEIIRTQPTRRVVAVPNTTLVLRLETLFKPLLFIFCSFPGSPRGRPASLKSRLMACAMAAIVLTCLFHYVALLVFSLTRGFEHASIRRMSSCIQLTSSTVIVALLISRSHEIILLRSRLLSLYSHLPALDPSSVQLGKMRFIIWFTAATTWLHIVYVAFQGFLPDTNETSLDAYFNELWFGLDARRLFSPFFARCLWNVEWIVYVATTDGVVYPPSLFYVAACFLLRARQRDFRLTLKGRQWKHTQSMTPKVLRDLQRLHAVLTETAQQLEDIFSPIVFCAYVSCLLNIVDRLYNFLDGNFLYFSGAPGNILLVRRVAVYCHFGFSVWFFLLLSAAAALVNEEPSKMLPIVEKMILDVDDLSVASSLRASFLLSRFSTPLVQLTAWKVLVISRSFVFTVFGAFLTYGVIIFQFLHLGDEPLTTK